jgi:hypothetical protein
MGEWPGDIIFLHVPVYACDELRGRGAIHWVRKAIEQSKLGKKIVGLMSLSASPDAIHELLQTRAIIEPMGRVAYEHIETRKPHPSPPLSIAFVLYPCTSEDDSLPTPLATLRLIVRDRYQEIVSRVPSGAAMRSVFD